MTTQFATVSAQFVAGAAGAKWTLPVSKLVDDNGDFTNSAYNAITEVVESGTTLGVTARNPHNKPENKAEVESVIAMLNREVGRQLAIKQANKQQFEGDVSDMVVIGEGLVISAEEILHAMETTRGLVIGGECETAKGGYGFVEKFEANKNGLFVHVNIDGVSKMFASKDVTSIMSESELAHQEAGLNVSGSSDDINQLEQEVRALVEGYVGEDEVQLTAAEQFEAREAERAAGRDAYLAARSARASAVANSSEAQAALAFASKLLANRGNRGQAPAQSQAPQARVANREANKTQNNQNNGGNVQMANNNTRGAQAQTRSNAAQQDRPTQGVAGGSRTQTPSRGASAGRSAGAPSRQGAQARQNNTQGGNARMSVQVPNRQSAGAGRLSVGAARQERKGLRVNFDSVKKTERGAWYLDQVRFPNAISGEEFDAARSNAVLGITDAKMYDPKEYYQEKYNKEANENDLALVHVFFGAVNLLFKIRLSVREDAKSPWYNDNITFVENRRGNGGTWKYKASRREDTIGVYITEEGTLRQGSVQEIERKECVMMGGNNWKNEVPFGIEIDEAALAQVMRWVQFCWDLDNGTEA